MALDLDRRSPRGLLLGASVLVLFGGYSLASGGEETLSAVLYVVAGVMMVTAGVAMYRDRP
jgi:hypothetical protein